MKPRYILVILFALCLGFSVQQAFRRPAPPSSLPAALPAPEAIARRAHEIAPIGLPGLEMFFETTGRPGVLYLYRSDCAECARQRKELIPLMRTLPFLIASVDDSRETLARSLAVAPGALDYVPFYVPPSRVLVVRSWLRDRGCGFGGTLPYIAVTDGYGNCAADWEGFTSGLAVASMINSIKQNNAVSAAAPQ